MFFKKKIWNETKKETTTTFTDILVPKIEKYLSPSFSKFVRPIPKTKKKLTKSDKLKMQLEDMEVEHEEQITELKKDFDHKVKAKEEELEQTKEQLEQFIMNAKIGAGAFVALLFVSYIIYYLLF